MGRVGAFLLVILAVPAVIPARPACAAPPAAGQRLRVDYQARGPGSSSGVTLLSPARRAGTLIALDSTSLDLETRLDRPAIRIPLADIDALALSRGRSAHEGAVYGALYGAALGLAIGALANATSFNRLDPDRNEFGVFGMMAAGGGAAVIGWNLGRSFGREAWDEVPVRSLWESR